jgi:hypothetical protein
MADPALRLENPLPGDRIGGEDIGGESGKQQAGDHGAPHATVPLASLDYPFNAAGGPFSLS